MNLNELTAISPVDGRYRSKTEELAPYFSEFGLIKYRLWVEIEYFIALSKGIIPQLKGIGESDIAGIRSILSDFNTEGALKIKEIEKITNHDVKAVEYYLKEKFKDAGLEKFSEFIHFGLTSQDINNTAFPLMLREYMHDQYLPVLHSLSDDTTTMADEWK